MSITTHLDVGERNGGGDPTAKNQGAITVTQYGVGNNQLAIQPHPRLPAGTTTITAKNVVGEAGGNSAVGGGVVNSPPLVYLIIFHTGKLQASMGTVTTDIVKANTPDKQQALTTTIHPFLMDGKINLQDLDGDYKQFTDIVVVPGTYVTKVTYGHGIGSAVIGQVFPVSKKLLALFAGGVGGMGLEQAIVLPQTLWDISRVKNLQTAR